MAIHTTYTEARANFVKLWDSATIDRETVVISRRGAQSVALVSVDELRSLEETAHLLRSPANANRLLRALERATQGQGRRQTIESLREEMEIGKE